jgi:F-type H+-transporting ATPase subunit epsilon
MEATLPSHIQLEIVTPDRQVVHDLVESVTIPGKGGYLGILPGHAPLLSELRTGEVVYSRDGTKHYLAVSWGFAEVLPSRVIILVQTAERAEEIDLARAAQALERAEERLKEFTDPTIDAERAREAYQRALARLQAARRSGG